MSTTTTTPTSGAPTRQRPPGRVGGLPLTAASLRRRRRGLVFWALGLAAVVAMYVPLYPSLESSLDEQIAALPDGMAQAFGMGRMDAPGYVQSTVFGLLGAVLLIIFALTAGARAVAAEEESGLLDLYLAHGVSRQRLLAERALGLLVELVLLVAVVAGLVVLLGSAAGLGLSLAQVAAAGLGLLGLGVVTGVVGLAAGAATGSRGLALAAAAVVGVGGYLADVLADLADLPWLRSLSTFHWAYGSEPLRNGFDGAGGLLLLYGAAALAYLLGAVALARRDIGV